MKTVFIINPMAGQGKNTEKIIEDIKKATEKSKADVITYITKSVGDARNFVKDYCEKNGAARFIACGGDGTLGEVLNGMIDCEGAQIGVIPSGTGNDFYKNFREKGEFSDPYSHIIGKTEKCDVIKYKTILNGEEKTHYCINMINIGFDCNVADMTGDMKKKPFISGSLAYFLSIFVTLVKKKGANLLVELDGKKVHEGPLLLASIANGCYCGGGIKSNPLAEVSDGFININIIKDIPRRKFIPLLPHYMKGTHMGLKNIENIIISPKCKKITITPLDGDIRICNDGEILDAGEIEFEILHNAIEFVIPR